MEPEAKESTPEERIVTIEHIKQVLLADKGTNAHLVSWKLSHFTKFGDNYIGGIVALEVKYSLSGREEDAFYVVKHNPQRGKEEYNEMNHDLFLHESDFYLVSLPELNEVMKTIGQPPLSFPKCFHSNMKQYYEQIYFEDLRKKGYKLFDRKKGMDVAHADLVLRELARLHAASLLLQTKSSEPIKVRHKQLQQDFFSKDYFKDQFLPLFMNSIDLSVQILKKASGYERAITWIENIKPQVEDIFREEMNSDGYDVICHGDCWNNNILFRYDSNGFPIKVKLIDLQGYQIASLATDLNYLMYSSLTSEVRRPNLDHFLNTYYKNFEEVTSAGGMVMPFTKEELLTEFRSKNKLGVIFSMLLIPVVVMEPRKETDFEAGGGDVVEALSEVNKQALASVNTNPIIKSRFLSTFDEFMEIGLIN